MPRTRSGEIITWKEFFKRWKKGIQSITPFQQVKTTLLGLIISVVGIIWGIGFGILLGLWWLVIILVGALFVTSMQILANYQKYRMMKKVEEMLNDNG